VTDQDTKPIDRDQYVATVLQMYLELPETPSRARPYDRDRASEFYTCEVSLSLIESALLLGSLRRLGRPPESPRLSPIRSLAYFIPVLEELTANPLPNGYLEYLRYKMRKMGGQDIKRQTGTCSNKSVFS